MKLSYTIVIVIWALFCVNTSYCETPREISKKEVFSIYLDKSKKLNLSAINISMIKYSTFSADHETKWYGKKVWDVGCLNSGIGMEIDAISGIIRGVRISRKKDSNVQVFKDGAKPVKNKEDIVREARDYLITINSGIPKDIFLDMAEYDVSHWRDSKYSYEGYWIIGWGRETGGYRYRFDGIRVSIHEKYGLLGYGYNIYSDPPDSLIVNISKEKAIGIAKPFAKKMARLFGYKSGEALDAELQITNPNYFKGQFAKGFSKIGVKDYSKYPQSYTRLAWIVSFSWGYDEIFTKNYDPAHVWIDAETGEILGGGS